MHTCIHAYIHTYRTYIHACTYSYGWAGNQPTYLSLTCSIPPGCRGCAGNRQSETCRSRTTPARMHIVDAVDVSHPNTQSAMHAAFTPPHPTMAFLSSFSVISTGTILPSCTAHPTPQPSQHNTAQCILSLYLCFTYTNAIASTTQQPTIASSTTNQPHHTTLMYSLMSCPCLESGFLRSARRQSPAEICVKPE